MITGFLSLFSGILPIVAGAIFLRYRNSYIQGRKKLIVGSVLMMAILPGLFLQVLLSYLFSLQTILVHQVQTGLYSYETITLPIDQTAQFILLSIGALFVGLVLLNHVGKILLRVSTAFYSLYPIMGMVEWIFSSSIHPSGLTWEAIFLHTYNSQFELIIATLIACISFLFFHANKDGPSKTITSQSKTETAANGAEDNTIIVFEK